MMILYRKLFYIFRYCKNKKKLKKSKLKRVWLHIKDTTDNS